MEPEHLDVLIVGAGLSGVGAAHHLQERCPGRSYAILEARDAIGGTWDLFRYPGIRSDSDMFTLGFSFRPWEEPEAIAPGPKEFDLNLQQFSITEERAANVDFSSPYYATTQVVITVADSPASGASSIAELKELNVGAQTGTTSLDAVEEILNPRLRAKR